MKSTLHIRPLGRHTEMRGTMVRTLVVEWVFWKMENATSGEGVCVRFMSRRDGAKRRKKKDVQSLWLLGMSSRHPLHYGYGYITFTPLLYIERRAYRQMGIIHGENGGKKAEKKIVFHFEHCARVFGASLGPRQVIYCRQFPGVRCAPFFSSLSPALSPRGSSFVPKSKFIEPIERTARINFLID